MDFIQSVIEMQSGRVAEELNAHWQELLDAVLHTGGKGKVTVTFSLKPTGVDHLGKVSQLEIGHDVKLNKPRMKTGSSFFFTTPEGQLSRKDQRQQELEGFGDESPIKEGKR